MANRRSTVQFIQSKGYPEWAVIPYAYYLYLKELDDLNMEVKSFKQALSKKEEELIPEAYANRLIEGENPIRVWRAYRKISQSVLAQQASISVPFLSQIESGKRQASMTTLKKIAQILHVSLDDIASPDIDIPDIANP